MFALCAKRFVSQNVTQSQERNPAAEQRQMDIADQYDGRNVDHYLRSTQPQPHRRNQDRLGK